MSAIVYDRIPNERRIKNTRTSNGANRFIPRKKIRYFSFSLLHSDTCAKTQPQLYLSSDNIIHGSNMLDKLYYTVLNISWNESIETMK